ncbi:MAG: TnpV protein [Firmicutes bacterium]|nr:TnpV protein [Bacillota bacterium]
MIKDERSGIQYKLIGDYYYPCLMMEEPPTLSKYGQLRERYLREYREILCFNLLTISCEYNRSSRFVNFYGHQHIVLQLAIQCAMINNRKEGAYYGDKKRECNGSCAA